MNTSVTLWTFLAKVTCCRISRFQLRTPFAILCAWLMDVCDYNLIDFRLGHMAYLCLSSFHTIQTLTEDPYEAVIECISRNILLIHNICSGSVLPCDGQYFKTIGLPKPRAITISRFWGLWCVSDRYPMVYRDTRQGVSEVHSDELTYSFRAEVAI